MSVGRCARLTNRTLPTRTPLNRRSPSRRWRQNACEQRQSRGHFWYREADLSWAKFPPECLAMPPTLAAHSPMFGDQGRSRIRDRFGKSSDKPGISVALSGRPLTSIWHVPDGLSLLQTKACAEAHADGRNPGLGLGDDEHAGRMVTPTMAGKRPVVARHCALLAAFLLQPDRPGRSARPGILHVHCRQTKRTRPRAIRVAVSLVECGFTSADLSSGRVLARPRPTG